jgi:hypothetical protein
MAKKDDRALLDLVQNHSNGRYQAISDAMQKGASPFQSIDSGPSATQSAIDCLDIPFIGSLIEHPEVNFDYSHALQHALKTKNNQMLDFIVLQAERKDAKLDPNALDSPLETVTESYHYNSFSMFCRVLSLCETPNLYDWEGHSLLNEASNWPKNKYFEHLIAKGGDVCLPVNKYADEEAGEENLTVLESIARDPAKHKKLDFVLQHSEVPFTHLEKAFQAARENGAEQNAKLLQLHCEDLQWEFDPEWPSRVTRHTPQFMPQRSLTEIFNFDNNYPERISILKNTETEQETMSRESFSQIDDKDTLKKAADLLEKFGGKAKPPADTETPVLKTRPAVKTIRRDR